jgi:catechol 2,3-dioxygenase-like lactoylglutathione lyase family enzyme
MKLRSMGLLALAFAVPMTLFAQPPKPDAGIVGIAHIAFRVSDVDREIAFLGKLGYQESFAINNGNRVAEVFVKINDRQFIELYPVTDKDPKPGFLHLCFEGADLNAIYTDYIDHGLTPTAVRKAGAGNLLFTMAGPLQPWGPQNIEDTQYMPGSLHSNDEGKHLGSNRIATKLIAVALAMTDTAGARDFYINQLHFKPIANDQMSLHMPGESGQEVEIVTIPAIGTRARLILGTENLAKSGRLLHKEGVAAVKNGATLTITDPDDNVLILEVR